MSCVKKKKKKNVFLFLFPAVTNQEEALKKAIKESEIFLLSIFYKFFVFIKLLYFIMFFFTHENVFLTHEIYPHARPTPTPMTHDLYPLPMTHI